MLGWHSWIQSKDPTGSDGMCKEIHMHWQSMQSGFSVVLHILFCTSHSLFYFVRSICVVWKDSVLSSFIMWLIFLRSDNRFCSGYNFNWYPMLCVEDRLPSKGVCSSRVGWWSAWHSGAVSAVQAESVILLAKSARELSCQLRPNVTTPWWNSNVMKSQLWLIC